MRKEKTFDFRRFLNPALAENPYFAALFEQTQRVIEQTVLEPVEQLARARQAKHIRRGDHIRAGVNRPKVGHIERREVNGQVVDAVLLQLGEETLKLDTQVLHQRGVLIQTAADFGFDYFSSTLSNEDLERVVEYVNQYWPERGRTNFIDFVGFVKNMDLELVKLWDRNYDSDDPTADREYEMLEPRDPRLMSPVWEGGTHYPTSHVGLTFDALHTPEPDLADLINLFYFLAPINLVLERISAHLRFDRRYSIVSGGVFSFYEQAVAHDTLAEGNRIALSHFALGRMNREVWSSGVIQQFFARDLDPGLIEATFVPEYFGGHFSYSQTSAHTVVLKCYVPAEAPFFRYDAVVLYAQTNTGGVEPYYLRRSPLLNPKFSVEHNRTGKAAYFMLELTFDAAPVDSVLDLRRLVLEAANLVSVGDFHELNAAIRQEQNHGYAQHHANVDSPEPHYGFVSEDQWYGAPLVKPELADRLSPNRTYYTFASPDQAPSSMSQVDNAGPNSGLDYQGRPLYTKTGEA